MSYNKKKTKLQIVLVVSGYRLLYLQLQALHIIHTQIIIIIKDRFLTFTFVSCSNIFVIGMTRVTVSDHRTNKNTICCITIMISSLHTQSNCLSPTQEGFKELCLSLKVRFVISMLVKLITPSSSGVASRVAWCQFSKWSSPAGLDLTCHCLARCYYWSRIVQMCK